MAGLCPARQRKKAGVDLMRMDFTAKIPGREVSKLSFQKNGSPLFYSQDTLYRIAEKKVEPLTEKAGSFRYPWETLEGVKPYLSVVDVALNEEGIFATSRTKEGAVVTFMDNNNRPVWTYINDKKRYSSGSVACRDGGCYLLFTLLDDTSYIVKVNRRGQEEWEKEYQGVYAFGPRCESETALFIEGKLYQNHLPEEERQPMRLLQLDPAGRETCLESIPLQFSIKPLWSRQGSLVLIISGLDVFLGKGCYIIKKYDKGSDGHFSRVGEWQDKEAYVTGDWAVSPSGEYIGVSMHIIGPGEQLEMDVGVLKLEGEGMLQPDITLVSQAIPNVGLEYEVHYAPPLMLDNGDIYSAWHSPKTNPILFTSSGSHTCIRNGKRIVVNMEYHEGTLYIFECSGNDIYVSVKKL